MARLRYGFEQSGQNRSRSSAGFHHLRAESLQAAHIVGSLGQ
jgi:hypothetical protein